MATLALTPKAIQKYPQVNGMAALENVSKTDTVCYLFELLLE